MLQEDFIDRLPEEGARLVARSLLDEARTASRRLLDPRDAEALHDFRVALRRLRSTASAYREQLSGSIPRKRRRQLRALAAATGTARDAEVQIAWLGSRRDRLPRRAWPTVDWLIETLEARRRSAYREVRRPVRERFGRLEPRLREALSVYPMKLGEAPRGIFAGTVADLLRSHVGSLHGALGRIAYVGDSETAHQARIEGKRLRYLLEPLRGNPHADASEAVKTLKGLQDVLGELNDGHVLLGLISRTVREAASQSPQRGRTPAHRRQPGERSVRIAAGQSLRYGLGAIDRLAKRERDRLFRELEQNWLDGRDEPLVYAVESLAAALAARAGPAVEIERKYLLKSLPMRARRSPRLLIEQGWLPGASLQERIRRTESPEGERFFRCVKQGVGLRRTEIEEETSRELFERLWPLTEGRRIRKLRHRVPDGKLVWEVDEFLDRDLVLAEVELTGDAKPRLPRWLEPAVVREVTGDPRYLNVNLAAARPRPPRLAAARRPARGRSSRG
jgi:CHAD domain-containing protein/CYTH domain-containing protein